MPNNYFQFKEFTIYQDRSTLKVSTDSCILGAWASEKLASMEFHVSGCLDIGAGTGLLMLMLAQRFAGNIQGIEIDRDSYEQATENINNTPWHNRLQLFHDDIKLFSAPHQYDFIISNPPFFEADLKSVNKKNNIAKHNDALNLADLLEVVNRNLTFKGNFAVLLPQHRMDYFLQVAANNDLFVSDKLLIRQTPEHPFFRCALWMNRKNNGVVKTQELTIRQKPAAYSYSFTQMMKEYYLYL